MPTYYDSKDQAHVLTEEIGRGGEGTVYSLEDVSLVAKIYHEPITSEKAEKLVWMAANKNEQLLRVAAWVVDVLYDRIEGHVAGFLMPNISAKEIHELYSLKSRRVHFPEATWPFLIHTSANLARAFYNLHAGGHVVGDVNHGNCVVLANGTVKLIDCDSYSIRTSEFQYPCEVGVLTHLAPELHGQNLREVERKPEQDNFGLAVVIFQLLFLGRHPFSGNYLGAKDKTLEDCIREYRFAYGAGNKAGKVEQPPGSLSLSEISPLIAELFERAFAQAANRPEPREWIEALEDLSRTLEQCSLHPGHHYFQELAHCPWCRLEGETGLLLFPFVNSSDSPDGQESFNIFTIENLIENLGIERNLPVRPAVSAVLPPPTPGILENKKDSHKRQVGIIIAHFVGISLLMFGFGIGVGVFFGLIMMLGFIIYLNNAERGFRDTVNQSFYTAREDWKYIEKDWKKVVVPSSIDDDLVRIRTKIGEYQRIQQVNLNELKRLQDGAANEEFSSYLRTVRLADVKIPGVKERDRKLLISRGINTAEDVQDQNLIKPIDEELAAKLRVWRRLIDRDFKRGAALSEPEKKQFLLESRGNRRIIEREIEAIFSSLRAASLSIRRRQQQIVKKAEEVGRELVQAESDMESLGTNSAAILALLLITFLTPFLGGIVSELNSPSEVSSYAETTSTTNPYPHSKSSGGVRDMNAPPIELDLPDPEITDREIRKLSKERRNILALNLYRAAQDHLKEIRPDLESAERKLWLARRFNPNDTSVLNELGYVLYEKERYSESLEILAEANEAEESDGTDFLIGINYLRLKRFTEARDIFLGITNNYSATSGAAESFYNLGLAYHGLKDHALAVRALHRAVDLAPEDVDAIYELGFSLYKTADHIGAKKQYNKLQSLDSGKAAKLQKATEGLFNFSGE